METTQGIEPEKKSRFSILKLILIGVVIIASNSYNQFCNNTPTDPPPVSKTKPGFTILPKWPFIIHGRVGYMLIEHKYRYAKYKLTPVSIHEGHVGVIEIKGSPGLYVETLKPGTYYLPLDLCVVHHVDTRKQHRMFKIPED